MEIFVIAAARHDFVGNAGKQDVSIPRNLVGVVIGKGGDMIKRITQETGARLQLKPGIILHFGFICWMFLIKRIQV